MFSRIGPSLTSTGDIVEQQRLGPARVGGGHGFRQGADFEIPVRAVDTGQLAHLVEAFDQFAQVEIAFVAPVCGLGGVFRYIGHVGAPWMLFIVVAVGAAGYRSVTYTVSPARKKGAASAHLA